MFNKTTAILRKYFLLFITVVIVVSSQIVLLKPHLDYGFSDVDWGLLTYYKETKKLYPNLIENLFRTYSSWGVYTHQAYYIGLQSEVFNLDSKSFNVVTHIFKILATLATYPLFLIISGSGLVAAISVILFAFAYPAAGTLYTTVTSSDYSAVLSLTIFLWFYWYVVKNKKELWLYLVLLTILFYLTLFLSTERMYPVIPIVFLGEFILIVINKFKKTKILEVLRRFIFLLPLSIIIFMMNPLAFLNFPLNNGTELLAKIRMGDLSLILTPFISLGSLILPLNLWRYLGLVNVDNLGNFIIFLLNGPLVVFTFITITSSLFSSKPIKFIIRTLSIVTISSLIVFYLSTHHVSHFDISFVTPALLGFFILSFSISIFFEWKYSKFKDTALFILFAAPVSSFIYIFITWLGADTQLIFTGVHRYLTVPALFMSFFASCLIVSIARKLWKSRRLKFLAILPFFLIFPVLFIGTDQITGFFKDQLHHGFGAADKQMMRRELLGYLDDISNKNPSLFYFDFTDDKDNGYYYDNTLLGGFKTWMLWHKNINFNRQLTPEAFWNDPERLKSIYTNENGQFGFKFDRTFYSLNNFYAFKLKNKKILDYKSEILSQLSIRSVTQDKLRILK